MWYEWVTFEGWSEVTKASFTLHGSSDPILIFFSHVAQIGYDPQTCKQEKSAWIPSLSDWFQASFNYGNKSATGLILG